MMGETRREGIVVLGCPRSGTTLLRRLLDAHPAISAPGETYLLSAASRFLDGERMVDGLEVGVLNGVGFLGFDEAALLDRLREFIFAFRREHAAREGKRRWLEKTAVDAFHVDAIRRICGSHVHYICLVRHGLDVVCSMEDWIENQRLTPRRFTDISSPSPGGFSRLPKPGQTHPRPSRISLPHRTKTQF